MVPSTVFQVLIKTCKQISVNTAGKRALKLGKLPSLNVIRPKRAKIFLHKVVEFCQRLYGGGHELAPPPPLPTIETAVKFRGFLDLCLREF